MLRELHIHNLAVIADARIDLSPGLNCFTGTTGAGKSLVIGAIELLLAFRPPGDMLRAGCPEARITGLFDFASAPSVVTIIESLTDLSLADDGGELLLTRRITASGKSHFTLNGHPITLSMLRGIAERLVDIHGQHDAQYLLKPANQLAVIDSYGNLAPLVRAYAETYAAVADLRKRRSELLSGGQLRRQQLELAQFQLAEIEAAEVTPNEFEELTTRSLLLNNTAKLKQDAGAAHESLYDADNSILQRLNMVAGILSELATLDARLTPTATTIKDATLALHDCAYDLSRYLDRLDIDPAELDQVNDRLNTLNRILRKYGGAGGTTEALLQLQDQLRQQVATLCGSEESAEALDHRITDLCARLTQQGKSLNTARRAATDRLVPLVEAALAELGMENARFRLDFTPLESPAPSGPEYIEFAIQTNPGMGFAPLRKIASGGELSRIMLAIKGIIASKGDIGGRESEAAGRVSVLVFDEVDSNVGGRLGSVIGRKLQKLANSHQVLCITHLPQIAAHAGRHLTVRKHSEGDTTLSTVIPLEGDSRLRELAEMTGGKTVTATTLAQAQELLDQAAMPMVPVVATAEPAAPRRRPATGGSLLRGKNLKRVPVARVKRSTQR